MLGRKLKAVKTIPNPDDHVKADRISGLPDDLLCHILSFLGGTREAAATSVLSTRWRYVFALVPDIELVFEERERDENDNVRKLGDFVALGLRVFSLRNGAPLRSLKLSVGLVYKRFETSLDFIISSALRCQVQKLEIVIRSRYYTEKSNIPKTFTCQSLVCLKLMQLEDQDLPNLIFLPNLKVLQLECKKLVGDWVQRLFHGCPVLEDLTLWFSSSGTTISELFHVWSPSVKKLDMHFWGGQCTVFVDSSNLESLEYWIHEGEHKAMINAPNLEYFSYNAPAHEVVFIEGFNSLVRARLAVGFLDVDLSGWDAIQHLDRVQKVKCLSLNQHILEAVYDLQYVLPTFNNLITLELQAVNYPGGVDSVYSWRVLPSLFAKAPKLEVLVFDQVVMDSISESSVFEFLFPELFPTCFIERLKEIEIKRFYKKEYEFKLVEYLLQNGKGLKKMTLGTVPEPAGCETILSFKRCSEDCQIVLDIANDLISMHDLSK